MKNLHKHFNVITKNKDLREVLKHVNFNSETGSITATDSHRLLTVKTGTTFNGNYNLMTMQESVESYPNTERLFTDQGATELDVGELTSVMLQVIKAYKKETVKIFPRQNKLDIETQTGTVIAEIKCIGEVDYKGNAVHVQGEFLYDALLFIRDFHKEHGGKVFLNIRTPILPIQFSNAAYKYVVSPVRAK